MTNQNNIQLPNSWKWDKLGKVCKTTSGGTPSRKNKSFYEGNIPWIKSGELNSTKILDSEEKISKEAIENSSAKIFPKGTLLIALYGATIGKLGILGVDAATNQAVCGIYKNEKVETKFLYWYLFSKRRFLVEQGIGGAQPNISQTILKELEIPLPPLPEQQRIVSKIEELFSEIDKAVENLQTARQQLKTYRQSVLKHAFEGKLTAAWRESSKFKARLNDEVVQVQSLKLVAEPESVYQTKNGLPEGWVQFRHFLKDVKYGTSKKCDYDSIGFGVLRIPNIINGFIDISDLKFAQFDNEEIEKYRLEEGDILLIRSNGSVSIVGKTAVVLKEHLNLLFAGYLIRLRLKDYNHYPKFYNYLMQSHFLREQIESKAKSTSGVNNINSEEIKELKVPVFKIDEQRQIVAEIEKRFSEADKLEESIETALRQTEALRQSILKKAFEGKLVGQCENKAGE